MMNIAFKSIATILVGSAIILAVVFALGLPVGLLIGVGQ